MKEKEWYKNIVENNSENPPDHIWEGIQDELDIDGVWDRIESDFDAEQKKKWFFFARVAASVLLVIAGGGLLLFFSHLLQIPEQVADRTHDDNTVTQEVIVDADPNSAEDMMQTGADVTIPADVSDHAIQESLQDREVPVFREEYADRRELYPKDNGISIETEIIAYQNDISSLPAHMEAIKEAFIRPDYEQHTIAANRFSGAHETHPESLAFVPITEEHDVETGNVPFAWFGLTGQLANTWMLNDKTFEAFRRDEFTATEPSFGSNLGMRAGVNIDARLSLQTEFMWHSRSNQHYREYIHGNYVQNSLTLDYYMLSMLLKYSPVKSSPEHWLLAGGYGGLMKGAVQNIDGHTREMTADYHRTDYGLLLGYEYRFGLGRHFSFNPGVFIKTGLNNIFSGNEHTPYYLNRTRNASFNLSFSIEYHIF